MSQNDQNQNAPITLHLPEFSEKMRLDSALAKLLPAYSRTTLQAWIAEQRVHVNGAIAKANLRVHGGEEVEVCPKVAPELTVAAEAIPLDIVYEDEAVLIINKPIGLVVHPGNGNPGATLLNGLLHYAPELRNLPRAGILHRLDKNTSGLLMIAKTAPAYQHLARQLKARTIVREYQALVYGTLISGGTITTGIGRHALQRKLMAVRDDGKLAITHYRVLARYRAHTLLTVRLETGRTHQIRVHMQHIKHPLVGDITYGGRVRLAKHTTPALTAQLRALSHQALHAYALGFLHPLSNEFKRFEIPLPQYFQNLLQALVEDMHAAC